MKSGIRKLTDNNFMGDPMSNHKRDIDPSNNVKLGGMNPCT